MLGKIVIVDRDIEFAKLLKQKIDKYHKNEEIIIFDQFPITFLEKNDIDLLFIDDDFNECILMSEMLRRLKQNDMQIIIMTNKEQIIYDVVSWFPIYDCRKKDLDWELERVYKRLLSRHFRKEINVNGEFVRVGRILYAKSTKHNIIYYLIDGNTISALLSLEEQEQIFKLYNFIRCSKKMIINPYFINNEINGIVTMKNGVRINIDEKYLSIFKNNIEEYMLATT